MTPTDTPQGPTLEQIKSYIDELEKGNKSDPLAGMQAQPPVAPEPAEPPKFKVKLPDGREFEGTQDEVNAAYNDFAQRLSAAQAPQQPERRVTAEGPSYDPKEVSEEFARRLQKDPVDGMRYIIGKYIFGVDDPGLAMRTLAQINTANHQDIVGMRFQLSHPEFESTPENVAALDDVMRRFNIPSTLDGLEAAYAAAKGLGKLKIKDRAPEPANVYQMPQVPQAVPPRVSRNQVTPEAAGSEAEFIRQIEKMTPEQLLELDRRIQRGEFPR